MKVNLTKAIISVAFNKVRVHSSLNLRLKLLPVSVCVCMAGGGGGGKGCEQRVYIWSYLCYTWWNKNYIQSRDKEDIYLLFINNIYSSVPELKDKIVLNPQFLVNALKSLITAERFCEKKKGINWRDFQEKGILTTCLLGIIFITYVFSVYEVSLLANNLLNILY